MKRLIIASVGAVALFAGPAWADYYIVHGPDRHCRVVERISPEEHDLIRVGPLSFGTREDAERDLKVVCHDNGYYRDERRVEEHHLDEPARR